MKYTENDLVRIAKRENNAKRNYLVVNPLQGKHIPVIPSEAMALFDSLADTIRDKYANERLLLIGFAETATAIGARVAVSLGTSYIQTTREIIPNVNYLFFSEEHSHATEQKLVKNDIDRAIGSTDRIIFVEDELTTGKTILNVISAIKKEYGCKYGSSPKFAAASLLNGMSDNNLKQYEDEGINLHYLVKTDHSKYGQRAESFEGNGRYIESSCQKLHDIPVVCISGKTDARRLVNGLGYAAACTDLWQNIADGIGNVSGERVLVIGTEEFMYPALFTAYMLEMLNNDVRCHSTTRSPIWVSDEKDYPLHTRYELNSLYDSDRRTFLYDIGAYDRVLIVTDASCTEERGLNALVNAVGINNTNITVIRWC